MVAQGTHSGPIFLGDKTIVVRSESGSSVTTIEGILDIAGDSPTIDGFKLTNGPCQNTGGHGSIWGGSSPTFINCQIVNGCATRGGGYDLFNSSATFVDCEFSENNANTEGGALYIDQTSSVTLTNCTIKDNTTGSSGGGIFNRGALTISYSSIVGNDGGYGSGITNYGKMNISNSTISDNGGHPATSGGIQNEGSAILTNCTIQRNFGGEGAGIGNSGDITLINSNISDNDGSHGIGGILNFGSLTLINTTISGNKGYFAGGIDNVGFTGGNASLTNCTVSNNSASSSSNLNASGGVVGSDTVKLQNTILSFNTAPHNPDCSREVVSLGHNLIGDPTGCTIRLQANDLLGDPGLGTFTDDGTPGYGHLPLLSDSRAIDAGNNDVCLATDQLENPRVDGDGDGVVTCDIGAVEFQDIVLINDLVTFEPDPSTYALTPDTTSCQIGAVGKFSFDATLNNISEKELLNLYVEVTELTNDNLLLTQNGLIGQGGHFAIPKIDDYADGYLTADEYVDVPFTICLQNIEPFRFFVDVVGVAAD